MTRRLAEKRGRDGETRAAVWLRAKGWQILDRRVKTPAVIAFVEVKWRRRRADLDHAVDEHRLSRVAAAVEAVAHRYAGSGEDIRLDVILLAPGSFPRHIANAWQP